MGNMLKQLADERDNLLLGEVAALLHNLAKLSDGFIVFQLDDEARYFNPFQVGYPSDNSITRVSQEAHAQFRNNESANPQLHLWDELSDLQRDNLRSVPITLLGDPYNLAEILTIWHLERLHSRQEGNGHFAEASGWLDGRRGYALWLLDSCHTVAAIDKSGEPVKPRQMPYAWLSSPFGNEYERIEKSGSNSLGKRLQYLNLSPLEGMSAVRTRNGLMSEIDDHFPHGLGDTRRPINEITLWDWSWSVAALYKAALAQLVIEGNGTGPTSRTDLRWRTLRVTVDVLGLLVRGHRISDVLGYQEALDGAFDRVKQLIEVEFPLGNEIYRDSTGIYFTFPGLDDPGTNDLLAGLARKIRDCMTHDDEGHDLAELSPVVGISDQWGEKDTITMLSGSREASYTNIQSGAWSAQIPLPASWDSGEEICPVCGLRPYKRSPEYRDQRCEQCRQRARGILGQWATGKRIRDAAFERETPWLDEIADEHDRVALIVGRFRLDHWLDGMMIGTLAASKPANGKAETKEPSPARMLRVWRTTKEFWTKIVEEVLPKTCGLVSRRLLAIEWEHGKAPIETEDVLNGTVNGLPLSIFRWKDGWLTIINPALCNDALHETAKVQVRSDNGDWRTGEVKSISTLTHDDLLAIYRPFRTIFTSPDQFLALVPGEDALGIAAEIADRYAFEMGKVRSRLPLDLSLIYFHRKTPLYAVIDAARRFLSESAPAKATWKVQERRRTEAPDPKDSTKSVVVSVQLTLTDEKDRPINWDIRTSFGDGSEDDFYPYVALASGEAQPNQLIYTTPGGVTYVHVKDLQPRQKIAVAPSHFSYLWLDSSTRRYAAGLSDDEDAAFSTQRVPLEEIAWLNTTWDNLSVTDTTLQGVIQLLLEKRIAWKDDATFRAFAQDVIRRQKLSGIITAEDIASGRFFRCFDLHHRIMKQKLSD
jgi:hypothetical protein